MFDLSDVIHTLASSRPVFHSEADFQHALAWRIHEQFPGYRVRLEYPTSWDVESKEYKNHLDVAVLGDAVDVVLELKYKKAGLFAPMGGEIFLLKNDGAQDLGRYDFLKDVQRLEKYVSGKSGAVGYAIFLTNDSSYWTQSPRMKPTASDDFRLTEGRKMSGTLKWGAVAGKGTTKGREAPIVLNGTYQCVWQVYSNIAGTYVSGSGEFRWLMLKVS